jgi:hypothetical protein
MIRRQWNALRVGHHVLVHDGDDAESPLIPGRVTEVETASGSNLLTIRISPPGRPTRLVQPKRLVVHLDSGEPTERCWRCEIRYGLARTEQPPGSTGRSPRPTRK